MPDVDPETALRTDAPVPGPPPVRDDDGDLNRDYVAALADAVEAGDAERVGLLVEDLHESDLGDLIEALAPERESLWRRVAAADFLDADEKREAVGYGRRGPAQAEDSPASRTPAGDDR